MKKGTDLFFITPGISIEYKPKRKINPPPFAPFSVNPLSGSEHLYKYRLALVVNQECVMRYDNEPDKGDHKHIGDDELNYKFTTTEKMLEDFWHDVEKLI